MSLQFLPSRRLFLKSFSALGLAGCAGIWPLEVLAAPTGKRLETITETRLLMGTFVSITLADESSARMAEGLERAFSFMESQIKLFDRHDAASAVGVLNSQGCLADAPPELLDIVRRSRLLGRLSAGAFDVTVQPVLDLLQSGSNPGGALLVSESELLKAGALVSSDLLKEENGGLRFLREGMGMTLDGIAKGHIADVASGLLVSMGLGNHLINAGGDIVTKGGKGPESPWTVAVSDPARPEKIYGGQEALAMGDGAIATSGVYRAVYDASGSHHHLLDPRTGRSTKEALSVTVRAKTALEADALATALSVLPPHEGLRLIADLPGRECMMITQSHGKVTSKGWNIA